MERSHITLENAYSTHAQWKSNLLSALECDAPLDVDTIKRDDCCDLGQWIYSDGKRHCGHRPEFVSLVEKHKNFHMMIGVIADAANHKDKVLFKKMIDALFHFGGASTDVGLAILELRDAMRCSKTGGTHV